MHQVPDYYKQRLADLEGYLPDGKTPKNRLVFAPETFRAHGKLAGRPKYCDFETGKPMTFWVWETWYPPEMLGSRETWPYELLGPYPADCSRDCCNGGYWGVRSFITTDHGEYIGLSQQTLEYIERRQWLDVQWSLLGEVARLEEIEANLSRAKEKRDAEAVKEIFDNLSVYATNKEKEDNADNRVFSFGEDIAPNVKGAKMPVGSPDI